MKAKPDRYVPALRALACAAALVVAGAVAAEEEPAAAQPEEVTSSETDSTGEAGQQSRQVESEGESVRTRREHGQVITEYERRGGVYLMTVKPRVGPTQYWNDPDGDGQFQRSTSDDINENLNLPKWRLGGW